MSQCATRLKIDRGALTTACLPCVLLLLARQPPNVATANESLSFFSGPSKKKFYDDLVIHTHDATWPCIAPRIPTSNIPSLAYLWVTPLGLAFCFSPFAIRYISSEAKKGRTTLTVLGTTPLGDQGCPNGPHSLQLHMCPRSYPRQLDRHTLPDISCPTLWPRRRIDDRQLHTSRCPAPRTCTRAPT